MAMEAIVTCGWEVLPHPPFSPDLAPTDLHLFPSSSNVMSGVLFHTDAELRAWLDECLVSRSDFCQRGIENLVECWEEVVSDNGE